MRTFLKFSLLFYIGHIFTFVQIITIANVFELDTFKQYIVCVAAFAFIHIFVHNLPEKVGLRFLVDKANSLKQFLKNLEAQALTVGLISFLLTSFILSILYKIEFKMIMYGGCYTLSTALVSLYLSNARLTDQYKSAILNLVILYFPAMVLCLLAILKIISADLFVVLKILWSLGFIFFAFVTLFIRVFRFKWTDWSQEYFEAKNIYILIAALLAWATNMLFVTINEEFLSDLDFKNFTIAHRFAGIIALSLGVFVAYFQKNVIETDDRDSKRSLFIKFINLSIFISLLVSIFYFNFYQFMDVDLLVLCFCLVSLSFVLGSYSGYFINPMFLKKFDYHFFSLTVLILLFLFYFLAKELVILFGPVGSGLNLLLYNILLITILHFRLFYREKLV